jgi:hypothetical protein
LKKPFYGWIIVGVALLIDVTKSGAFQAILALFHEAYGNEFGRTARPLSVQLPSVR